MKKTCPFCLHIGAGRSVELDSSWVVLVNSRPVVEGHVLLTSRRHVARLTDLSSEEARALGPALAACCTLARCWKKRDDVDISIQDGESAGQTVMHVHAHIVPRASGDPLSGKDWAGVLHGRNEPPSELRRLLSDAEYESEVSAMQYTWRRLEGIQ